MTIIDKSEEQRARELLLELFPRGSTVFTVIRHVARSGMMRVVGVLSIAPAIRDGLDPGLSILHPNNAVALLIGARSRHGSSDGVVVKGCGFDAGQHIVNALSWALYQDDNALKQRWL